MLAPAHIAARVLPGQQNLTRGNWFQVERLVNLSKHDYSPDPNVTLTLDGKWIVFRSNILGPTHVFEVEVAKAR